VAVERAGRPHAGRYGEAAHVLPVPRGQRCVPGESLCGLRDELNAEPSAAGWRSPVAIVEVDFEGRVRSWNPAATQIFGWSEAEVVGRFNPTVPEDELELFLAKVQRIRAGETVRDLDLLRLHRDGSALDVSISAGPIRDAHGGVVGVIALIMDVTARKRSERALAASEARKDAVLRTALDCVVIVDHDGLIAEVNPATEETFGWTRSDAIGTDFLELAIAPQHRAELADVLRAGESPLLGARLEVAARRSDDRVFTAELAISRVDIPGPLLFAVTLRDVTRRQQNDARLRAAEAKYRTLVEQLPLATYINETGLPLRTQYVSPQIEQMLGYPAAAWLEPGFFTTILHPGDAERVLAEIERTHATGEDFRDQYRLIAADGRTVWVLDETVAVRDEEYRPLLLQGFFVDVTARVTPEAAAADSGSTRAPAL
jgi:PAS domain S-box-containing protein